MIVKGFKLFEEDQPAEVVEALSEKARRWLSSRGRWRSLKKVLEARKGAHADPSRSELQVLVFAWNDLLRDHLASTDVQRMASDLERSTKSLATRLAVAGGEEALRRKAAEHRGLRESRAKAKRRLWREAGQSSDIRECIAWALKWEPVAKGPKPKLNQKVSVRWELIEEPPPGPGAIGYLEQAVLNPDTFFNQVVPKFLAKKDDGDDPVEKAEKKACREIVGMLAEVRSEISEKGDEAYA